MGVEGDAGKGFARDALLGFEVVASLMALKDVGQQAAKLPVENDSAVASSVSVRTENRVVHTSCSMDSTPSMMMKRREVESCEVIVDASIDVRVLQKLLLVMDQRVVHPSAKDCFGSDSLDGSSLATVDDVKMHRQTMDAPKEKSD